MRDYPTVADDSKDNVAVHVPSARWSAEARMAQSWYRNPNARGIAEPDPRTVARGRRAPRALASPCPWSRRRVKRERQVQSELAQIGPTLTRLAELAHIWPDPAHVHALARALTAAEARRVWIVPDPTWERRTYERRTPFVLPRRADADATKLIKAARSARRFIVFAERQRQRDHADRWRKLMAALRPHVVGEGQPITRRPDERNTIDPHRQPPAGTQGWEEVAKRIEARILGQRPHDAM